MATRNRQKESAAFDGAEKRDYLFTWKPGPRWPAEELRSFVDDFRSKGVAVEPWSCQAHKKIQLGDRAYLLKQGNPIGIFGRGTIVSEARKRREKRLGESQWEVDIGFDALRGDVLWNLENEFLVSEAQLFDLPVSKSQWQRPAAGNVLQPNAAREIDNIIFDSIRVGRGVPAPVDEVVEEVSRRKRLLEQATRPKQRAFRETIRRNYRDRCAVTQCATPSALEAAHIVTKKDRDDNSSTNGILLRSDIHALFDNFLITLSEDGARIEGSSELRDPTYGFLRTADVARPDKESPLKENIREHRKLFFERQRRRSSNPT